jgi:hypothetical protein
MVSVSALPGLCSKFHKIDIIPGGVCEVNSLRHAPLQRAAMCFAESQVSACSTLRQRNSYPLRGRRGRRYFANTLWHWADKLAN